MCWTEELPTNKYPDWQQARLDVEEDPSNIPLWAKLADTIEVEISKNPDQMKKDPILGRCIHSDYDAMLSKYPYFVKYWKKYITIEYTLNGLEKSTSVLRRSLTAFPQSLDLWVDYLNVIISNKLEEDKELGNLFKQAADHIGRQFMSHPFWDIYLNWAAKVYGPNSNNYLQIYLQIIDIPLYQYAHYYEDFTEVRTKFLIKDLIPETTDSKILNDAMNKLNVKTRNWDQLDDDKASKLIETYFNSVFIHTRQGVTERWKYEGTIKQFAFNPEEATSDEETWSNYLEYEKSQGNKQQIKSLYERYLIPNCLSYKSWIKYLKYLISQEDSNTTKVFNSAIKIASSDIVLQYMLSKYYEYKLRNIEKAEEVLINLIERYPTATQPISRYFRLLDRHSKDTSKDALHCVDKYIDSHNKKRRKINPIIKAEPFKKLYNLLTYKNASQLIVEVVKLYWLKKHNVKEARRILLSYMSSDLVQCNEGYWATFFKFEMCQRNKTNLTNIINHVKFHGQMSITFINSLLLDYNNFMMKNSTKEALHNTSRELIRNIVETDSESSTSMKHFLKARLDINHNEMVIDKRLFDENGHPSGKSDGRPLITNPIDYHKNFQEIGTPPLPQFSNAEKANITVKYREPI